MNRPEIRNGEPSTRGSHEVDERLVAYLDGELEAPDAADVERQLAGDPVYRSRMQQLQRTWDLLDELPRSQPTESFTQSTLEMVASQQSRHPAWWHRRRRQQIIQTLVAAAALIGFALVSYSVTHWYQNQPTRQLIRDLTLIENLDMYMTIDSVEFLERLERETLFVEGVTDVP